MFTKLATVMLLLGMAGPRWPAMAPAATTRPRLPPPSTSAPRDRGRGASREPRSQPELRGAPGRRGKRGARSFFRR
jgi:hypothetical protein